jgi:hypothetical protein
MFSIEIVILFYAQVHEVWLELGHLYVWIPAQNFDNRRIDLKNKIACLHDLWRAAKNRKFCIKNFL